MKIGVLKNGDAVYVSKKAANQHVLVTGISGSGKSVRIKEIIANVINDGETVLIFDINATDYKQCCQKIKCVSAVEDGISLDFLKTECANCISERDRLHAMYIVDFFSKIYALGSLQRASLREAIFYAMENSDKFDSEEVAIGAGLEKQNSKQSQGTIEKMWNFFHSGILKKGTFELKEGFANVFSLEMLDSSLQNVLIELILSVIWRKAQSKEFGMKTLTIVIDEFQNLSLHKESILLKMLREARKYGIKLILSTQSIANCSKDVTTALGQTATQLYFRQEVTAVETTLKKLDPKRSIYWRTAIMNLNVGESIVSADVCVRGKETKNPLIIKSEYRA